MNRSKRDHNNPVCTFYGVCCILTHCGLVTPYDDRDLCQHWLKYWLVAWRHQAITWTNVDWSLVESSDIHIRAISQEMSQPSITNINLKIICLKFHSNIPGTNKLIVSQRKVITTEWMPTVLCLKGIVPWLPMVGLAFILQCCVFNGVEYILHPWWKTLPISRIFSSHDDDTKWKRLQKIVYVE